MDLLKKEKTATLITDLPDNRVKTRYSGVGNDFVISEEPGVVWLWAEPKLLGWKNRVTFMFSPVVGKKKWPGDLWGIDEARNLIVIENKAARGQTNDPLEDFLDFNKKQIASEIEHHWEKLYAQEMAFLYKHRTGLKRGTIQRKKAPGITPYSSKRTQTWRWRRLYLERVVPTIESPGYKQRVKKLLRGTIRDVHFVGLFTLILNSRPKLSRKGVESYQQLKLKATAENVHFRAVEAEEIEAGMATIIGWQIEHTDEGV